MLRDPRRRDRPVIDSFERARLKDFFSRHIVFEGVDPTVETPRTITSTYQADRIIYGQHRNGQKDSIEYILKEFPINGIRVGLTPFSKMRSHISWTYERTILARKD